MRSGIISACPMTTWLPSRMRLSETTHCPFLTHAFAIDTPFEAHEPAPRDRHLLARPARWVAAALPALAGRRRPQSDGLQFRSGRAIARRRRQRRSRSDPAACLCRTATARETRRCLDRSDHVAILGFFPDAA